jgi:gluconate 2-dehydrogenase gamma chain
MEIHKDKKILSRRRFLKLAGAATVSTATVVALESCATKPAQESGIVPSTGNAIVPIEKQYPEVPYTPGQIPDPSKLMFFSPDEAALVDAICSRILPGDAADPGAHEAEVVIYIDRKLSWNENNGFVEPTFFRGPYAKVYEGDTPPGPDTDTVVYVKKSEIDRYGFQGSQTPQETYHKGLASVDNYAQSKFKKKFIDLTPDQQDQILTDMEQGKATGFDEPIAASFFQKLRDDTIEGMFADPVYGGNRDMVGWKLIGYPGAQRAYTPVDLHDEQHIRPPQDMLMLHPFHPGQPANSDVIVPPSGSDNSMPIGTQQP